MLCYQNILDLQTQVGLIIYLFYKDTVNRENFALFKFREKRRYMIFLRVCKFVIVA
jgi:hypothetical protein